ncbi:MAG: hypothetical protein IKA17_06290, partial [Clostridia bacterium]|nr:hypothetical protein [Clostridia bacterium]
MAEFCLDCLNKINGTNHGESYFVLSRDLELCEECGQWKRVVITRRQYYYSYRFVLLFCAILKSSILFLWKVINSIYRLLKNIIKRNN